MREAASLASDKAIERQSEERRGEEGGRDRRTPHQMGERNADDATGMGVFSYLLPTAVPCWYLGAGKFLRQDVTGSFVRSAVRSAATSVFAGN